MMFWFAPVRVRDSVTCARSEIRLPMSNRAVGSSWADCCVDGSTSDGVIWKVSMPNESLTTRPTPDESGVVSNRAAPAWNNS